MLQTSKEPDHIMSTCVIRVGNASGGTIKSPNFGEKYPTGLNRLYIIQASPGHKILLEPVTLKVEGQMKSDGQYGKSSVQ